jgi:hypothetical protein
MLTALINVVAPVEVKLLQIVDLAFEVTAADERHFRVVITVHQI